MKNIRRLFSNFQFLNFFLASMTIAILFSWLYLSDPNIDNIDASSNNQQSTSTEQNVDYNLPISENGIMTQLSEQNLGENSADNTTTAIDQITQEQISKQVEQKMMDEFRQKMEEINQIETPSPSIATINPNPSSSSVNSLLENNLVNSLLPKTSHYGHLPFAQTSEEMLVKVGEYYGRKEFLNKQAAQAFNQMKTDADQDGIQLVVISGFRTIAHQTLLFQKQVERKGSKQVAAQLSAPPGYSEHHTGYALDLGDGKQPQLDLKFEFESSEAYRWLFYNAHKYGFELSFPRNNVQGVSFEPWHWRFVASPHANQTFAVARNLQNTQVSPNSQ